MITPDGNASLSASGKPRNLLFFLVKLVFLELTDCFFIILFRVGKGVFKRGSEVPSPVISEEQITEIRVGSWSYVEGSIGKAPGKLA